MADQNEQNLIIPEERSDDLGDRTLSVQTSPIPVLPQFFVAVGVLLLVFGITYFGEETVPDSQDANASVRVEKMLPEDMRIDAKPATAFDEISIEAQSAIVWDVREQRVLFNKYADTVHPLASITKLMTALVAYELLDPDQVVTITHNAIMTEGDSGFTEGEQFFMRDLADLTLIESSNDGAAALSEQAGGVVLPGADTSAVFVSAMNEKADERGLSKTMFKNSTGLDISEEEAGAYGSARDVAYLMEYLITKYPDAAALTTLDMTTIPDIDGRYHVVKNTNQDVAGIHGLIASKTGYTLLSGGNLVIAVNIGLNRPFIIAILGSSTSGRFTDALTLLKEARIAAAQESL